MGLRRSHLFRQTVGAVRAHRAGFSGWTFHTLRHFFVTELCRMGAPPTTVQRLAGHAELTTTQRYAHMVSGDAERAIALFDPVPSVTSDAKQP
jgi:site-specific recombinase XerD